MLKSICLCAQHIEISLEKKLGRVPQSTSSKPVSDEDSSALKIPNSIHFKFYNRYYTYIAPIEEVFRKHKAGELDSAEFIKRLKLYTHYKIDSSLMATNLKTFGSSIIHFVAGIDENDNKIILADADQSGDISENEIFRFTQSDIAEFIKDQTFDKVRNDIVLRQKSFDSERTLFVRIVPLPPFNKYPNEQKKLTSFYLLRNEDWEGSCSILERRYNLFFESKQFSNEIQTLQFRVEDRGVISKKIYGLNDEYNNDEISLIVDSVRKLNDIKINAFITYHSPPLRHNDTTFSMFLSNVKTKKIESLKPFLNSNKYILVDYWGTWCKPCIEKIPHIKDIQSRYKEKLIVISIAYDYQEAAVDSFDEKNQINWSSYFIDRGSPDGLVKALDVQSYPTYRLYDQTGRLLFSGDSDEDLEKITKIVSN
jgi:thiol-disulfide isomerase/thioredoxin